MPGSLCTASSWGAELRPAGFSAPACAPTGERGGRREDSPAP